MSLFPQRLSLLPYESNQDNKETIKNSKKPSTTIKQHWIKTKLETNQRYSKHESSRPFLISTSSLYHVRNSQDR